VWVGRFDRWASSPGFSVAAPATCPDCAASTYSSVSFARCFSRSFNVRRMVVKVIGRAIGLDVHLDFCEVAVCEEGKVRSTVGLRRRRRRLGCWLRASCPVTVWLWR
jgi:hypothetical protein